MTEPESFEQPVQPPPDGSEVFLPFEWNEIRSEVLTPRFVSDLDETPELRQEFVRGATALGLVGRRKTLHPQQLLLADVLNAGCRFTGVLLPRRSTKTTTILAWLIGRGLSRPDYLMAYGVMTSQKKARDRFVKDVVPVLERVYPDASTRPFKIVKANGQERINFSNGSILQILGPKGDDYRSDAFDVIVLDEAGEAEPDDGEDVLAAALPTQDTRPEAMLVMAGTAARYRDGNLLWDELEAGRSEEARHGVLDYSAEDADISELDWESVEPLVLETHPGVGNLTTIESIQDNFTLLAREQFSREYLGIFGTAGVKATLFNIEKWAAMGESGALPEPPKNFKIAWAINLDSDQASVVAAWRDEKKRACIALIDHRTGNPDWVDPLVRRLAKQYRTPVTYDKDLGPNIVLEAQLKMGIARPKLDPQNFAGVGAAASLLIKEFEANKVRHWNQPELNAAVAGLGKRVTTASKKVLFARLTPGDDITPIEAAALALRSYDDAPAKTAVRIVSA